jgi:predicted Rossmann fold nucleotide-binding protein DprA/Smf involved in DNA uptake
MDRNELQYWVAFGRVPQIGRARIALLEARFGTMAEAWQASPAALQSGGLDGSALSGWPPPATASHPKTSWRSSTEPACGPSPGTTRRIRRD